jgi:hypothetical protein
VLWRLVFGASEAQKFADIVVDYSANLAGAGATGTLTGAGVLP